MEILRPGQRGVQQIFVANAGHASVLRQLLFVDGQHYVAEQPDGAGTQWASSRRVSR